MSSNPNDIPQWLDPTLLPSSTTTDSEDGNQQQQQPEFAYDPQHFPSFAINPDQGVMIGGLQQYHSSELSGDNFQPGVEPSSGPSLPRGVSREPQRQGRGSQSSSPGRTSAVDRKKIRSEKKRRDNIRLGIETLRNKLPLKYSKDATSDPVLLEKVAEYIEDLEKQVGSSGSPALNVEDSSAFTRSEPGPSTSKSV